jgi:DNA-binding IclR family transcriptional regulator
VQDAHKAYRPGPVLAHIGLSRTVNADLRSAVRPVLEQLNRVPELAEMLVAACESARRVI